jgi:hypothetical protein
MGKKMNAGIASAAMAGATVVVGISLASPASAGGCFEDSYGNSFGCSSAAAQENRGAENPGEVFTGLLTSVIRLDGIQGEFRPSEASCPGTIVEAWEFGPVPGKGMSPCADD